MLFYYQSSADSRLIQNNRGELFGTFGKGQDFLNTNGNAQFSVYMFLISWGD
jgi:hypothetical protein